MLTCECRSTRRRSSSLTNLRTANVGGAGLEVAVGSVTGLAVSGGGWVGFGARLGGLVAEGAEVAVRIKVAVGAGWITSVGVGVETGDDASISIGCKSNGLKIPPKMESNRGFRPTWLPYNK